MKSRCHNKNDKGFKDYGERGIAVDDSWRGAGGFARFLAHIGPRPSAAHSLDRIVNDRGYEPGNVRWATKLTQMRNTRHNVNITLDGRTQCLTDWCKELGRNYKAVHLRIKKGWDVERALKTPIRGVAA